jgi:DNA-binding NtrC family response regulator
MDYGGIFIMNKIAIIDDEYSVLESLKWVFEDIPSYNLHLFQDPFEAIDKIREEEFAVVISDYVLPDMDGKELLKQIKEKWPSTECFIITAFPNSEGLKNTNFPVVVKPWDIMEFKSLVNKAVKDYEKNRVECKKKILFVDNETSMVKVIEMLLGQLGHEVYVEMSGSDALKEFRSEPEKYDMVITDMSMPDMDGVTLAEEMLAVKSDIPIILCTGLDIGEIEEDAKKAGIRGILIKPFSKHEISQLTDKIFNSQ